MLPNAAYGGYGPLHAPPAENPAKVSFSKTRTVTHDPLRTYNSAWAQRPIPSHYVLITRNCYLCPERVATPPKRRRTTCRWFSGEVRRVHAVRFD